MSGVWHSTHLLGFISRNILVTSRGSSPMSAMFRPSRTRDLWIRGLGTGIFMMFGSDRSVSIPLAHGSCWGPTLRLKPIMGLGIRACPFGTANRYPHQTRRGTALPFTQEAPAIWPVPLWPWMVQRGKKHPAVTWCNRNNEKVQAREHNSPSHTKPPAASHSSKVWNSKLSCLKGVMILTTSYWYKASSMVLRLIFKVQGYHCGLTI